MFIIYWNRTPEGQQFLSSKLHQYEQLMSPGVADGHLHAAAATYLEKLGKLHMAVHHLKVAVKLLPQGINIWASIFN